MSACTPTRSAGALPAAADRFLPLAGARLRYRDTGRGPAVLLLHGWTLDLDMWEPQAAALADAFRLVRLDRRGFGLSTGRPSVAADVADLQALLRHLGLERVALVGMSQGARVALRLAQTAPASIAALVFDGPPDIDAAPAARDDDELPLERYRALMRTRGIDAVRQEWVRHPLAQLRSDDPGMRALLDAMLARYPGHDLRTAVAAPDASLQGTPLESLGMPALVVTGALDLPSRQQAADSLARRLPAARRVRIAAAGHLPNLDNPQAYDALLREFLARPAGATH